MFKTVLYSDEIRRVQGGMAVDVKLYYIQTGI